MTSSSSASRPFPFRLTAAAVAAIVIGSAAAIIDSTSVGWGLEERFGLRWLFSARGDISPPNAMAIVAINPRSARQISLPKDPLGFHRCIALSIGSTPKGHETLPSLPARWPRCLHALLVERLAAAGARVIVFDMLFRERRPLPVPGVSTDILQDEDASLARAAEKSARVLIAQKLESGPGDALVPSALAPAIEHAVLGSAPHPLPVSGTDRYDRFIVFVDQGWPTVTLPAVAVLAYSLPAYDRLRDLLSRADPKLAGDLPPDVAQLRAAGQLQATALMLFSAFKENRTVRERILADLSTASTLQETNELLLHSLIGTFSGPETRYVNFYGQPGRVLTLDFSAALSMEQAELVRLVDDKVVVVGFLDDEGTEQVEHFATAATPSGLVGHSGAEILASSIGNLIEGSDLRAASRLERVAIFLALAAVICAVGFFIGTGLATAASVVAGIAYAAAALLAFQHARLWLPVVLPLAFAIPLSLAAGLIYRYQEARRQRDRIRALFAKFVPPEFVARFEHNAGNLVKARRSLDCACVATDAAHFTTFAETMRPEDLAELLDRYFERLFGPVALNGGLVSDIVGDAMLALWPVRDGQTRSSVCRALLEMLGASTAFSGPSGGLSTRFGADLGPVSLGALGGQEHYEYRAVGDPVNTANRLQELNKKLGTRILVSEALVAGLDEFLVRDLGRFLLRGKTRPVRVFELMQPRVSATPDAERLCAQFAAVAESMGASDLAGARRLLQQVVTEHPGDAPAAALLAAIKHPGAVREGTLMLG